MTICLKDHASCPGYYRDTLYKRLVLECRCPCHGSEDPTNLGGTRDMYKVIQLELSDDLKNHGFSRIAIEADTLVIIYNGTSIRTDIEQSWNKTIEGFKKYSKDLIPKKETLQGVISFISEKWLDLSDERRKRAEELWEKDQANAVEERARREKQKRQQEQKQQYQHRGVCKFLRFSQKKITAAIPLV